MAVTWDALLRIRAQAEGKQGVDALAGAFGTLSKTAQTASGSFAGITRSLGGVLRGFQMLTPLATGAGLVGLAQRSIETGDALYDMSQRTGVSVELLSRLRKAAQLSGTNIDSVSTGILRMSKAMVAAASDTGMLGQRTEKETDRMVKAVREGEARQVDAVQSAADKRIGILERESDQRLRELGRRYRNEGKLIDDRFDDRQSKEQEAIDEELRIRERAIERQFDLRRSAIESDKTLTDDQRKVLLDSLRYEQEDTLKILRDGYSQRAKERQRALRDERQKEQDALDDRRYKEEEALKSSLDKQKNKIKESTSFSVRQIKSAADESVKALKGTDGATDELSDQLEDLGLSGKGASDAFRELGVAIKNQDGTLRNSESVFMDLVDAFSRMEDGPKKAALAMKIFGRGGAEIIPLLNMGSKEINAFSAMSSKFAKEADIASDSMITLGQRVGSLGGKMATVLMPLVVETTNALTGLVEGFGKLDPNLQKAIGFGAMFAIAWGPISGTIINTIKLFGLIAPALAPLAGIGATVAGYLGAVGPVLAGIGATIAGWAGAIAPAIAAAGALFSGFVAFLTSTILPALVAFFSGPAGWVTLAAIAVAGLAVAFREPIGQFFQWLVSSTGEFMAGVWTVVDGLLVKPFVSFWSQTIPVVAGAAWAWLYKSTGEFMAGVWTVVNDLLVKPFVNFWSQTLPAAATAASTWLIKQWQGLAKAFGDALVVPIANAWNAITQAIPKAMESAARSVGEIWSSIVKGIGNVFNSVINSITGRINSVARAVNRLIGGFNNLPGPDLPFVPTFAKGGYVKGPTLALIGEGGEGESVVPDSKRFAFARNVLSGVTGAAAIPQFANGGYVKGSSTIEGVDMFDWFKKKGFTLVESKPKYPLGYASSGDYTASPLGNRGRTVATQDINTKNRAAANRAASQGKIFVTYGTRINGMSARDWFANRDWFAAQQAAKQKEAMQQRMAAQQPAVTTTPKTTINITTGPVLQFNNEEWVKRSDLEAALAEVERIRQASDGNVIATLRSPRARAAIGRGRR